MEFFKLLLAAFSITLLPFQPVTANTNDAEASKDLIVTRAPAGVISHPMLGAGAQRVSVYKGRDTGYYYQPALLPQWDDYRVSVGNECAENDDPDDKLIELKIYLESQSYRQALIEAIENDNAIENFNSNQLYFIPFDFMRVVMEIEGERQVIFAKPVEYAKAMTVTNDTPINYSTNEFIYAELNLPCSGHRDTLTRIDKGDSKLLFADLYRVDEVYDSLDLFTFVGSGLDQKLKTELFTDESTVISIDSTAQGTVSTLNVPVHSTGGAKSDGVINATGMRLVSRDLLETLSTKIAGERKASCVGGDFEKCKQLVDAVLPSILEGNAYEKVTLTRAEKGYVVQSEQLGYVTITDSKIAGKLERALDVAGNTEVSGKATTAKDVGVEASAKINQAAKSAQIGEIDITAPIATIADVTLISVQDIKTRISTQLSFDIPTGANRLVRVPFIYPATGYRDGSVVSESSFITSKLQEAAATKNRGKLSLQCKSGKLNTNRNVHAQSVTDKSSKLNRKTPRVVATAAEGKYISAVSFHASSSYSPSVKSPEKSLMVFKENTTFPNVYKSASAAFGVYKRGKHGKRYRGTASGWISVTETPMKCAEFLVEDFILFSE